MTAETSTARRIRPPYQGQKGRCAWCGTTEIPKGRISWCSDTCVDEYRLRSDAGFVRIKVFQRDKGICALCGVDSNAAYRAWQEARAEIARLADRLIYQWRFDVEWHHGGWRFKRQDAELPPHQRTALYREQHQYRSELAAKYAPSGNWTPGRSSGWDADHIVPVVEGGADGGLDNYRTLCHPCHKRVTAELAARRARKPAADVDQLELFT